MKKTEEELEYLEEKYPMLRYGKLGARLFSTGVYAMVICQLFAIHKYGPYYTHEQLNSDESIVMATSSSVIWVGATIWVATLIIQFVISVKEENDSIDPNDHQ